MGMQAQPIEQGCALASGRSATLLLVLRPGRKGRPAGPSLGTNALSFNLQHAASSHEAL
jgi:hypothetical protein